MELPPEDLDFLDSISRPLEDAASVMGQSYEDLRQYAAGGNPVAARNLIVVNACFDLKDSYNSILRELMGQVAATAEMLAPDWFAEMTVAAYAGDSETALLRERFFDNILRYAFGCGALAERARQEESE